MSAEVNEVYALRYAARPDCRASEAFYRHDLYGEPDAEIGMDYFFWLVRSGGRTALVDCGFNEETGPARNRWYDIPPTELLARMGTDPASVDDVVLSHMHFDHVGNTHLFPNATFHMARAEYEYWTGPHRDKPAFSWPVEPWEVRLLEGLRRDERLNLVDESAELMPGLSVTRFPGHTPGQLVTEIATPARQIVLASDAVHYYDEIDRDRPFYLFTELDTMLDSYEALRRMRARPDVDLIAGHDPAVSRMYIEVEDGCLDLTRRRPDLPPSGVRTDA